MSFSSVTHTQIVFLSLISLQYADTVQNQDSAWDSKDNWHGSKFCNDILDGKDVSPDVTLSDRQGEPSLPGRYSNCSLPPGSSFCSDAISVCRCSDAISMCRCSDTCADCSQNHGSLTFVPILPEGIVQLNFSYNNLRSIAEGFFLNATNITSLDLRRNNLTQVQKGAFALLTRLNVLVLSHNKLNTTTLRTILSEVPTLEHLVIIRCNLEGNGIFFSSLPLPKLLYLNMDWNDLDSLDLSAFVNFTNLRELRSSFNNILYLISDSMTSLNILYLNYNFNIYKFPVTCSNNDSLFPNLMELHLRLNNIVTLKDIDICLPKLQCLELSMNRFMRLEPQTLKLSSFQSLQVLFLESMGTFYRNQKRIFSNAFESPTIQAISLYNSGLAFSKKGIVDKGIFHNCPALRVLTLANNGFGNIRDDMFGAYFGNLSSLQVLDLGWTEISNITASTFSRLQSLQVLRLNGNSLSSIPDGAFDDLVNLTKLFIDYNRISLIKEATFNVHTRSRLHSLDLSMNPFQCSCDALFFQRWLLSNPLLFNEPNFTYECNNLPTIKVISFQVNKQACYLSYDVYILMFISITLLLTMLMVTAVLYRYRWHIRLLLYKISRERKVSDQRARSAKRGGDFQYDLFVSYASDDLPWVRDHLLWGLEEQMGLRLCLHQRDFLPGKHIMNNIVDSIETSRKMMLVFSRHYVQSQWCQFELALCIDYVVNSEGSLIVVCLQDLGTRDITAAMLAILKMITCIEWEDDPDVVASFWGRLRIALSD